MDEVVHSHLRVFRPPKQVLVLRFGVILPESVSKGEHILEKRCTSFLSNPINWLDDWQ